VPERGNRKEGSTGGVHGIPCGGGSAPDGSAPDSGADVRAALPPGLLLHVGLAAGAVGWDPNPWGPGTGDCIGVARTTTDRQVPPQVPPHRTEAVEMACA